MNPNLFISLIAAIAIALILGPVFGLIALAVTLLIQWLGKPSKSPPEEEDTDLSAEPTGYLIGNGNYAIPVVGTRYTQEILQAIAGPKTDLRKDVPIQVTVETESENAYDPNACRVCWRGRFIGYLPADEAERVVTTLAEKGLTHAVLTTDALIVGGWQDDDSEGFYGVRLDMPD